MKNKVYEIGNRNDLKFSVQKTTPYIIRGNAKEMMPEEITFLFEEIDPESDLTEDNNLAIRLLKLSTERVPENGLLLHNFSGHDFSVHHAKEDGVHIDEPIFEIGNLETGDIAEDGTISVCLTNESAKELIKALAKIV
mgnify:CR=1 FL=1